MYLYMYIIIYCMMLKYPTLIIDKSQVKTISWSKNGHNTRRLTTIH